MKNVKNYLILIIVSGVFVLLCWWLISQYARTHEKDQNLSLQYEIAEIKPLDLYDYLLETPDVIILAISDQDAEMTVLIDFLTEQNLLYYTVYLYLSDLTPEEIASIEANLQVSYQWLEEQNLILLIDDFELVDNMAITDDVAELESFFQKWGYYDD